MAPETPERWRQVETLLNQLLELDTMARAALLAEVGATDAALCRELEELLRADAAVGVLDEDILGVAESLLPAIGGGHNLREGDRIGPFRVLGVAGSGGMGDVYVAERADGEFEQTVALKLVRNVAGSGVTRRFLDERRILAGLEHPGIARLLDGGVTAAGVPWFAMEYVAGQDLTRYCDERQLPLESRLRLFLDVCDAVAYAHRNLVVHRDLKPANILVTGEGRVKLLDFGIARVLEADAGVATAATILPWLTPGYASPEQLGGAGVTTASDIYSLGVLLYELLCGQRPFRVLADRPHLLVKAIMEDDPKPPSLTLRRNGEGTSPAPEEVAGNRSSTPQRLARRLRGDLDAIVSQALRRQPDQRYRTADELADDLRRYLAGRPVLARRGSRWYATRRFVARNRAAVAGTASLVVLSVLFGGFHAAAVTRERDYARDEAERAERIADFLVDLFNESDPLELGVRPRPVTDFLAIGAERLGTELVDEPELRASMLRVIGRVFSNLGSFTDADSLFRAALEIRSGHLAPDHHDVLQSLQDLGELRRRQGQLEQADSLLAEALRRLPGSAPGEARADLLEEIAEVHRQRGDVHAADSVAREALDINTRVFGADHPRTAEALSTLGVIARGLGRIDEAEAYHRRALQIRMSYYGPENAFVAETMHNLALALHDGSRLAEARQYYEQSIEMNVRILGAQHPQLGPARNSYGALLRMLGEREAALEQYQLVLELQRAAYGSEHPRLAGSLTNAAVVMRDLGDLEGAERLAREALAMRLRLLGEDNPSTAQSYNTIGALARQAGRFDEAEDALQRADRIYRRRFGPEHTSVAINGGALAFVALDRGDLRLAEQRFTAALELYGRLNALDRIEAANTAFGMGRTAAALGRPAEAARWFREALRVRELNLPPDHRDVLEARTELQRVSGSTEAAEG